MVKDGRAAPEKLPVAAYFRIGQGAVPMLLFEALPNYWVGRFRYVGPAKELGRSPGMVFDPGSFLLKRQPQRNRLVQHSASLKQKAWAIKYHRGNLLSALEDAKKDPTNLYSLTVAGAEYAAWGDCLYSLLEELASVLGLLRSIAGESPTPSSFHDLHKTAGEFDAELGNLLSAADWYESFRLGRANSAHAFGAVVTASDGGDDLQLWQHPDPRIYSGSPIPEASREALSHVSTLLSGSDALVTGICRHMLGMFHPWDVVTFVHGAPSTPSHHEQVRVWVRELSFFDGGEKPAVWTLLDQEGTIRVATDERGGLVAPNPLP
jgi:hypothetical protein